MNVISIAHRLPELNNLERVMKSLGSAARIEVLGKVQYSGVDFPLYGIVLGTEDRTAPTLGLFGGVHGLERIGAQVVIAWLNTLSETLKWDETIHNRLKRSRLVFMPIVNPIGMYLTKRANGNGVDLMRNSPTEADEKPMFLVGGQRYSSKLPWFRGDVKAHEDMEVEARALCDWVLKEMFQSQLSLAVDVHSGFGAVDRLWFPYAKTRKPPPHLAEIHAMKSMFDKTYPNHFYRIEPQAAQYTTHGDLWDYLYDRHQAEKRGNLFIPWTLELGSWLWLKKNPRQLFSSLGPYNPITPHRQQRILRRHLTLFDFLHRVILSPNHWVHINDQAKDQHVNTAKEIWYDKSG